MSTQFSGVAKKLQDILDRRSEVGASQAAAAWGHTGEPAPKINPATWGHTGEPAPKINPATVWGRASASTGSSITDGTSNTAWGRPTPNHPAPAGTPSTAATAWGRTAEPASNVDASAAWFAPLRTTTLLAPTDADAQQRASEGDAAFDTSSGPSKSLPLDDPLDDPFGNPLDTIDPPSVATPTPIVGAQPSQPDQSLLEAAKNLGLPADALQFAANGPLASKLMPGFLSRVADAADRLATATPTGEPITIPFFEREPRPGSFDEVVTQKTGDGGTFNSDRTHFFLRSDTSARSLSLDAEPVSTSDATVDPPGEEFGQGEPGTDANLARVPEANVDDPFSTGRLDAIGEPETQLAEPADTVAIPPAGDDAAIEVEAVPDAAFADLDM